MSFNQAEQPIISVGPFVGLDATTDPSQVDSQHAIVSQNVVPNRIIGAYTTAQGRTNFLSANLPSALNANPLKFFPIPTGAPGSVAWYLAATLDGNIYKFQSGGTGVSVTTGLSVTQRGVFTAEQGWAFYSDGVDTPIKIDGSFNVTNWGIAYPTTAPTINGATGGNLTVGGQYAYLVTFGNALMESSAGPLSAFVTLNEASSTGTITVSGSVSSGYTYGARFYADVLHTRLLGAVSYTAVSSDTVTTVAAALTLAINTFTGGPYGILGVTAASSSGVISLFGPPTNSGSFIASTTGGTISPTVYTTYTGGSSTGTAFNLSAIPISTDPQVTLRNIYRIGGSQSQLQLIDTINDNTTTTYTDTLADDAITGQTLVVHRDPPAAFNDIVAYQGRMWGLGYVNVVDSGGATLPYDTLSQVWYSLYLQPWAFDNTNQVLACGEDDGNDRIVAGAALPAMLVVHKRNSTWGIVGSSQQDYLPIPLFDIGCASMESVVTAYGLDFWISGEKIIYMFDGSAAPQDISTMTPAKCSVKGILDGFVLSDCSASIGFFNNDCYCLSFPTKNVTLCYYIPAQVWFTLTWATDGALFDLAKQEVTASVVGSGQMTQWFAAETDLGNAISSLWVTGTASDEGGGGSQARHLLVSSYGSVGDNASVVIYAGYGGNVAASTQTISLASNRQTLSLPPTLVGQQFQVNISASTSQKTVIESLILYAYSKRVLNTKG